MQIITKSVEETNKIAQELAKNIKGGEVILLDGELGAGKTTFTKGLFAALGLTKNVSSPTFTVMKQYSLKEKTLYHIDMYRLNDEKEAIELGIEDIIDKNSVIVIEWNKIKRFSGKVIKIKILYIDENSREITINGGGV